MKIKKLSILTAILLLSFTACKKEEKTVVVEENTTQVVDAHNAQNSLDWAGSYFGTLPCASCAGIETQITLNDDGTFTKSTHYIDTEYNEVEEVQGNFSWSADGNIVTLDENEYKVAENQLIMLDHEGKEITDDLAEYYILTKEDA